MRYASYTLGRGAQATLAREGDTPRASFLGDIHGDARDAAQAYARRGWLVFPCAPGDKIPATPNGFYAATTNPATIDRWWRANSNYNIGVRCGAGSRLWVLDVDRRHGGDA